MLIYNISLIRLSEGLYVNLLMICLFWIGSLGKYFHLFHFSGIRMEWNIRHRKFRRSSLLLNQANWSTVKIKSKLFNDAQRNFKIAFLDVVQYHNHKNQRPWTADIEVNMVANITREVATITKEVAAIFFEPKCFKSKLLRAKPYSGLCIASYKLCEFIFAEYGRSW